MTRVAFTLIGGKNWTGGYNYLLNLLQALAAHQRGVISPFVFFGQDVEARELAPFQSIEGVQVVRHVAFDAARKPRALVRSILLGRDALTQAVFADHLIDLVFESAQFHGWRSAVPAIAWIPDLQHRFLPHLFGRAGYWKRELGFLAQIACKRTVMVSSEDTRQHCESMYPACANRIHTVRFAVPAPGVVTRQQARLVADRYGLPPQYFFMPNQFWQHKNHMLVVEALALLERQGMQHITVVASGKTMDPRRPTFFSELQSAISERGLEKRFVILGLIPYEDLSPLMMASDALLNPSGFEGWSTTVEEAKARGVPMVLSDLPVHHEQGGADAVYFDPGSAQALADALGSYQLLGDERRDAMALEAAPLAEERVSAFAREFANLVKATLPQ